MVLWNQLPTASAEVRLDDRRTGKDDGRQPDASLLRALMMEPLPRGIDMPRWVCRDLPKGYGHIRRAMQPMIFKVDYLSWIAPIGPDRAGYIRAQTAQRAACRAKAAAVGHRPAGASRQVPRRGEVRAP